MQQLHSKNSGSRTQKNCVRTHICEQHITLHYMVKEECSKAAYQPAKNEQANLSLKNHLPVHKWQAALSWTGGRLSIPNCGTLYVGLPLKPTQTLQLFQNPAAQLLSAANSFTLITPFQGILHWFPVVSKFSSRVLVLAFITAHGLGCICFKEHLS